MYHSLIQILSAAKLIGRLSGATIGELEENLGITRRSVYRVLEALDELQYPYYKDEENGNRYHLVEPERSTSWWLPLPTVTFDLEDRILLEFLFKSTAQDPALAPAVRRLREKLSFIGAATGYAFAPKESGAGESKHTSSLLTTFVTGKTSNPEVEGNLRTLFIAATDHKSCEVSYESRESGNVKTYTINPLALFENEGGLYCFVEVPRYGSIIILALERIRELKPLGLIFSPPAEFDAEKRLNDPFGIVQVEEKFSVKLIFSEDQAPYVRDRVWPESYSLEDLPEGQLSMAFVTGGLFGLKRWLLSWGVDVEVIEPIWLRNDIATELKKVYTLYRTKKS